MFCTTCGKEMGDNQRFCTNCGAPTKGAQEQLKSEIKHIANTKAKKPWTFLRVVKYFVVGVIVLGLLSLKLILGAVGVADNEAATSNQSGLDALSDGDYDTAIKQLESASDSAVSAATKMTTLSNLGYAYSSDGKYSEALSSFREALTHAVQNSLDYYLIAGEIALLEGNPKVALDYYNKAYGADPDNFQVNNALNLFYLDMNETHPTYSNPQKALSYALKAYDKSLPELKSTAAENLGIAYFLNEDYRNSLSYFMKTNTQQPYMQFWIGASYFALEEYDTAKPYLQRAYNSGVTEANDFLIQY